MQEDEKPTSSAGQGGASPAGKEFNPSEADESAAGPAESSGPSKAVHIGRPISEAEYSRRKEQARDVDLPEGWRDAQEDPAHRERDG